jgi:hypothetical protein
VWFDVDTIAVRGLQAPVVVAVALQGLHPGGQGSVGVLANYDPRLCVISETDNRCWVGTGELNL